MEEIRTELLALSEESYRQFQAGLVPGVENILGVRIPKLRAMAKRIVRENDWRAFLREGNLRHYEEYMLQGMVIGCAKMDLPERFEAIASFVPKIDNWAVCDVFCSGLKFIKGEKEPVWDFLLPYFSSAREFEVRFAVVTALGFFMEPAYVKLFFAIADRIRHDGYYVKMAVAWAISIAYIKCPEATLPYLRENALDDFTYNKALQKITESFRVTAADKAMFRAMKRRSAGKQGSAK